MSPSTPRYMMYHFKRVGKDWTLADRDVITMSTDELERRAQKGKKHVGGQMQTMARNRRSQIKKLLSDMEDEDPRWQWAPVSVKDIGAAATKSGKKDVPAMDVIIARVRDGSPASRTRQASQTRLGCRPPSTGAERVDLRAPLRPLDWDSNVDWQRNDPRFVDQDPFATSQLFHSSGKPMDANGIVSCDNNGLPPYIRKEEPIGKKSEAEKERAWETEQALQLVPEKESKKSRKASKRRPDSALDHQPLDTMMGDMSLDDILDGGRRRSKAIEPGRRGKQSKSRARSKSRTRSQSRGRAERDAVSHDRNQGDWSSASSGDSQSIFFDDILDDGSSRTTDDGPLPPPHWPSRGSLSRANSVYHERASPIYREHFRGPGAREDGWRSPTRYPGECIVIPERRNGKQRSQPNSYQRRPPPPRQLTYGNDNSRSPDPERMSPRDVALPYPHELREQERRADDYMRAREGGREYRPTRRERDLEARDGDRGDRGGYHSRRRYDQ